MYTDKGYDRVVIDRAVERELYKHYAEDEQSALRIGAESKGTIRAMIAYMGYLEGMPSEVIQELDALVDGDNSNSLSTLFGQYVKQYEGINDRELSQRRSLQVHQWQITKKLLQDKKDDWDRMVNRIFERGMRQWNMMLQAFANRWRNWQSDAKETIVAGNKKWDERMKQFEQAKLQWFADAYSGMSAREIHVRLSNLEVTVNQLLSHMKETYGDAIATIDVHALLLEVLKDQPELLSEEVLQLAKTKVAFGLPKLTTQKYNKTICNEAQQLVDAFVLAQQRTHNLQLLKALTELLKRCREQLKAANEQAKNAAEQFVSAYGFMVQGDSYWRKLSVSEKKQVIGAFRPFAYDDSLILGTYNIPGLMQLYQRDDGVQFGATMQVVLTQVQTRMGMLLMPDVPWGFSSYVGEFGQIVYDGGSPKLEKEGKGEYRRITKEVYKAQKEKATEDAICQYTYAGIGVALSMATGNPFVGAAFMSYIQFQGVATGDMSVQHWAVQTGMQLAASAAGGYVEGVTSSGVYGTLASGGVQSLGNFVEYKADGGLGLQWGSKEQWRSSGIGTLTAMVGAKINAQSSIAALTRYGYTMGSSYIVNRFDGRGSWQDDMLQAGASTLAMIASSALLSDGTDIGKFVDSSNSTLVMQRFIQGTFENMLLPTGGMWIGINKGQSFGDILLSQNWQKTQYTLSDYAAAKLSEYCKDRGKDHAEKARKAMEDMDRKEGILGLAWLGLRKVESVLGSAVDGIIQWIDQNVQDVVRGVQNTGQRVVNWLKDGKWVTNEEKLQIAVGAALKEFEQLVAVAEKREIINKLIKKLEDEEFFKDASKVKGGVAIEYNKDGRVKRVVEETIDGRHKIIYEFGNNGHKVSPEKENFCGKKIESDFLV